MVSQQVYRREMCRLRMQLRGQSAEIRDYEGAIAIGQQRLEEMERVVEELMRELRAGNRGEEGSETRDSRERKEQVWEFIQEQQEEMRMVRRERDELVRELNGLERRMRRF
jgi:predicted  nucleic acid-binding Zn-ribbon protein